MKFILLAFTLLFSCFLKAQDSLVYYSDLSFNSDFEKQAFSDAHKNTFNLFLAVDENMNYPLANSYHEKYQNFLTELNTDKLDKKSASKKIKGLYGEIHDEFFEKYEMQNHFSDIFRQGFYNCVSATAIYGLIFHELGIPFSIKEKPTHVYMMAYPKEDNILVESTDPSGKFLVYNDRYKTAVVEQLANAKLISESDFRSRSTDDLFNEYYFSDEDINLVQLGGLQYLNDALYRLEKNDVKGALEQAEKAYYLYPKENIATLLVVLSAQLLNEIAYTDINSMVHLERFSRYDNFGITRENILAEFEQMTNVQLIGKGDSASYRNFYNAFLTQSKDDTLNFEITHLYNLKRGLALYNSGHYQSALPFIEKAYQSKSENLEVTNIFVSTISQNVRFESHNKKIIELLENYQDTYTALNQNNIFKSMLVGSYLIEFGQAFDLSNEKTGLTFKSLFEKNYSPDLSVPQQNVGRAYSLAAVYYFKKGHKQKALSILNKGLELAPGNYELLTRKRMIE